MEGRTIKYTNFPAKYMNSRSKLHWNKHVVLCLVSVTWNNHRGIGIPELRDRVERHSAFNSSSMWILLLFYFYDILGVFYPLIKCMQVYWYQHHHQTGLNNEVIDYYKILFFLFIKVLFSHNFLIYYPIFTILVLKWLFLQ